MLGIDLLWKFTGIWIEMSWVHGWNGCLDKPDIPARWFLNCLLTLCAHIAVRRQCTLDLSVVSTIRFWIGFLQCKKSLSCWISLRWDMRMPQVIGHAAGEYRISSEKWQRKYSKDFLVVKVADLNHKKTIRSLKGCALFLNPEDSSNPGRHRGVSYL